MIEHLQKFFESRYPGVVRRSGEFRGDWSFWIPGESLLDICNALKNDPELQVKLLADVTCLDWLDHPEGNDGRFEIVYNLYSLKHKFRFFLKVNVSAEKPEVPSLTPIWNGANWTEREVYDLFGIIFVGHPKLEKLLTPDELDGHPLRRDYPLTYEVPHFSWNKNDPPEVLS